MHFLLMYPNYGIYIYIICKGVFKNPQRRDKLAPTFIIHYPSPCLNKTTVL